MEFGTRAGALALLLCAASAQAADPGFYFGVAGGQAGVDASKNDFLPVFTAVAPIGVPAPGEFLSAVPPVLGGVSVGTAYFAAPLGSDVDFKHVDRTFSVTLGYRVNAYLAGELSYIDLGTTRLEQTLPLFGFLSSTSSTIRVKSEVETAGLEASLLGTLPLNEQWSLFGRAGYFFADSKTKTSVEPLTAASRGSSAHGPKYSKNDFVLGGGVEYAFAHHWSVRAEYQYFHEVGGWAFIGDPSADSVTLGIQHRL